MKKRIAVIATAASVVALGSAGSAQASDAVTCGFQAELVYEGGVTTASRTAKFRSGPTSANCAGRVGGKTVIGTGSLRLAGEGGGRMSPNGTNGCALGSGSGSIQLTVPRLLPFFSVDTSDSLKGEFGYLHAANGWEANGTVAGPDGSSGLAIAGVERPSEGDCVTAPMTRSILSGRLLIGGDAESAPAAPKPPCSNHVAGTRGRDRLAGTSGSDMVSGFGADDRLTGEAGEDCLFGGRGRDRLTGGLGTDTIDCGRGRDVVRADPADRVAANCETVRSR